MKAPVKTWVCAQCRGASQRAAEEVVHLQAQVAELKAGQERALAYLVRYRNEIKSLKAELAATKTTKILLRAG